MTGSPNAPSRPGLLLIDASRAPAAWRLWGMSLAERLRRQASLCGIARVVVWLDQSMSPDAIVWRPDLERLHPQTCDIIHLPGQLDDLVDEAGVLIAEGDVVYDDRLVHHLLQQGPDHAILGEGTGLAWLSVERWTQGRADWPSAGLSRLVQDVPCTSLSELGDYVPELRLKMQPFMIRLTDESQLRRVDHLMYRRTFKGVIDAIARYGYYHLVRFITRWLSRTTLSPNLFTVLSILGVWLAIPCFATGHMGLGCLSAWLGVLLDSIDGKLARLTLNLSDAMGTIEHLSAMPGLGLWFVGIGWSLTSGDLLTPSTPMLACWTTVITFVVDKLVSGSFRQRFGRELFDARPFDAFFHLFAVRRNMHLLVFTIGVLLGDTHTAFLMMAAGMVSTLLIHLGRYAWIAATGGVQTAGEG